VAAAPPPPPEDPTSPPAGFDPAAINGLIEDLGAEDAAAVLRLFLNANYARMASMRDWAHSGQKEEVEREAHSTKSAAALLGFFELSQQARALERDAPGLEHEDLVKRIGALAPAFAQADTVGRQVLQTIAA